MGSDSPMGIPRKMLGKWYVVKSNLALWKKHTDPAITYSCDEQYPGFVKDTLTYTSTSWRTGAKSSNELIGWDKLLEGGERPKFKWRGTCALVWVTARWTLEGIDEDGSEWAVTSFEKTLFTTAGADFYSRTPTLSEKSLKAIAALVESDPELKKITSLNGGMFDCVHS